MNENLKKAHNKAMKKAELTLDTKYLLGIVWVYLKGEKKPEEIANELAKKYNKQAKEYIKVFKSNLMDSIIEEGIKKIVANNEELDDKKFKHLLKSKTKLIVKKVSKYINGEISQEELLDFMINNCIKSISLDLIRCYGINMADIQTIQLAIETQSYDILAYAAISEVYKILMELLKEAEITHEERLRIEKECDEYVQSLLTYRNNIEEIVSDYIFANNESFKEGLLEMDDAILEDDSDGYIKGNLIIQEALGFSSQFSDQEEFEDLMNSDFDFVL